MSKQKELSLKFQENRAKLNPHRQHNTLSLLQTTNNP
jgi:hypothetical protein